MLDEFPVERTRAVAHAAEPATVAGHGTGAAARTQLPGEQTTAVGRPHAQHVGSSDARQRGN